MTTEAIIDGIIEREGGFVHHLADRGGPTNMGITLGTLSSYRGHPVTAADVAALTEVEARAVYRRRYINEPGFLQIGDDALRAVLVDDAVLSGPATAITTLQKALLVPADGKLGPVTLAAVNAAGPEALIVSLSKARCLRFARLVQHDPSQLPFLAGWLTRALSFL